MQCRLHGQCTLQLHFLACSVHAVYTPLHCMYTALRSGLWGCLQELWFDSPLQDLGIAPFREDSHWVMSLLECLYERNQFASVRVEIESVIVRLEILGMFQWQTLHFSDNIVTVFTQLLPYKILHFVSSERCLWLSMPINTYNLSCSSRNIRGFHNLWVVSYYLHIDCWHVQS